MPEANPTIVLPDPGRVEIEDRPIPDPDDDEVLVETERTLISTGTELTAFSGDFPAGSHWNEYADYPTDIGYMNVGRVVETGGERAAFEPGDRVVSYAKHAKYVCPSRDECYRVPDDVPDERAQFFAAAEIVMHAVRRGRVDWGESAAVFGLGLLGQVAVRVLQFAGARPVVGLNRSRPRIDLLPDGPGVVGLSTSTDDWLDRFEDHLDGDLADVVVEATGNADSIVTQLSALRRQGRFVMLGCPQGPTSFDFHDHCNWPSYEIIGAHVSSHPTVETPQTPWTQGGHVRLFFDVATEPAMADLDELVTTARPYEQAETAYRDLDDRRIEDVSVALQW
jgi:2-desacetyl-2-hydroxyethyl bacteriochlorophyllide A dehydrogenase